MNRLKFDIKTLARRYIENANLSSLIFSKVMPNGSVEFCRQYSDNSIGLFNRYDSLEIAANEGSRFTDHFFIGNTDKTVFDPSFVLGLDGSSIVLKQSLFYNLVAVNLYHLNLLDFHNVHTNKKFKYHSDDADSIMKSFILDDFMNIDYYGNALEIYDKLNVIGFPIMVLSKNIRYDIRPYSKDNYCHLRNDSHNVNIFINDDDHISVHIGRDLAYSGKDEILKDIMRGLVYET